MLAVPFALIACGDDSSSASDDYSSASEVPSSSSRTECPESLAAGEFCDTRDFNVYATSEIGALVINDLQKIKPLKKEEKNNK